MMMVLNRPSEQQSQTPETGAGRYVGAPQANLINGKGFYGDCALQGDPIFVPGGPRPEPTPTVCNVTTTTVPPGGHVTRKVLKFSKVESAGPEVAPTIPIERLAEHTSLFVGLTTAAANALIAHYQSQCVQSKPQAAITITSQQKANIKPAEG